MFKQVEKFNKEVILIGDRPMALPVFAEHEWLTNVIDEERIELEVAYTESDYIGYIDALIDNIYFCIGGLVRIGLNEELVEKIFTAVHECNMAKVRGKKTRIVEYSEDAIKPENWVSPEEKIIEILETYRVLKSSSQEVVG